MAMIDYGCVVKYSYYDENDKKNNIVYESKDLFYSEGIDDFLGVPADELTEDEINLSLDCFHYIGDRRLLIGFYKTNMFVVKNGAYLSDDEQAEFNRVVKGSGHEVNDLIKKLGMDDIIDDIYCYSIGENDRYRIDVYYKGDGRPCFSAIFGYGVDNNYKKQLKIAGKYGFSKEEIEHLSDFWDKPVYVKSVKVKHYGYNKNDKRATYFEYKYGKYKKV